MKYYVINSTIETEQGYFASFDTLEEAETAINTPTLAKRNGVVIELPLCNFPTAIIASDLDPKRLLFKKENGAFVPMLREWTAFDFSRMYEPKADRGKEIVNTMRTERLKKIHNGQMTIPEGSLIDAETKVAQFAACEGDLITCKVLLEALPDSAHKTELLDAINLAITELY